MFMIIIPNDRCKCDLCVLVGRAMERILEELAPEAKRELAADLLRLANRAEGYEG